MSVHDTTTDEAPSNQPAGEDDLTIDNSEEAHSEVDDYIDTILDDAASDDTKTMVREFLQAATDTALARYSIDNQILIYKQLQARGAEYADGAKHFAGYNTWMNEHNRYVESGSTGFTVIAPVIDTQCPNCGNTPGYHTNEFIDCERAGEHPSEWDFDPEEKWGEGPIYFKTATTFAYQQTQPVDDADPDEVFEPMDEMIDYSLPDDEAARANNLIETLTQLAESGEFESLSDDGLNVRIEDPSSIREMMANGISSNGEIHVTPQDEPLAELKTLTHELAHELLHWSEESFDRELKEVEAEAVAYAVCQHFDFNVAQTGSELYLATWAEHANSEATLSREAADDGEDGVTPRDIIKNRLEIVQEAITEIITTVESTVETT